MTGLLAAPLPPCPSGSNLVSSVHSLVQCCAMCTCHKCMLLQATPKFISEPEEPLMPFQDFLRLPGAVPEASDPSCDKTIQSEDMMDMDVSEDLCDIVSKPFTSQGMPETPEASPQQVMSTLTFLCC